MLKAKVIDMNDVIQPEMGTPQGGVLSSVLCNVALNGLENHIKMKAIKLCKPILGRWRNLKVHVVRYADYFIVVCPSKRMLKVLRPYIEGFLVERGLEISKQKSARFNIWEQDLEFLGFSFKKKRVN
jgi:RNA-directed DNA polymerase